MGLGFPSHFLLTPQDAAPVLVIGDGHPTLDADANSLFRRGFLEQKLLQEGHGRSPLQDDVTQTA